MESKTVLDVKNLEISFQTAQGYTKVVDGCSFRILSGQTLGLIGESGCGKSLTSLSLMGLLPSAPACLVSGHIRYEQKDLFSLSEDELCRLRGREISMIFQDPMTSLNPVHKIGTQIAEVLILHQKKQKHEAHEMAIDMLAHVGIAAPRRCAKEYPHQLSGGMRQRVMIAMALACRPSLLIADEPTTALDVTVQAGILALLNSLQKKTGMGILLVTHDFGVVAETCDEVAVMYAGRIVEKATVQSLLSSPLHPYTVGLLRALPERNKRQESLYSIPGNVPPINQMSEGCRFHDRCPLATPECTANRPPLRQVTSDRMVACFHV